MLVVVHIPKTAGTTLREYILRYVDRDAMYTVGDDIEGDISRLVCSPEMAAKYRLVFGHVNYGCLRTLQMPVAYTTILRDPLRRAGSLYDYAVRSDTHYLHACTIRTDFVGFMNSGITCTADNAMVRQLCGVDRFTKSQEVDMVIPFGKVTTEHLQMAKYALQMFTLVGLTERYQYYQDAFADHMDWPREPMVYTNMGHQINVLPYRKAVMSHLELDYELYEYARGLAA